MTLEDIIREVSYSVKDPQTQLDLKGFVNRAVRTIAERANFSCLHDIRTVVVPSGYDKQNLGWDFKQLSPEESPISFSYGSYRLAVQVTSRSRIELAGIWPFPNGPFSFPVPGGYMPVRVVFLERDGPGGQWAIHIPPQFSLTQDAVFYVQAYWYPFPLVKGGDRNPMTDDGNLSEAIIRLAASYAFRAVDPTDKRGDAAKEQAEEAIQRAMYSDAFIALGGRTLRM